jgi:hypothetical protein
MWNGGEQDDKSIELYGRPLDPSEMSNLALSKDHSEVIESLRRKWGQLIFKLSFWSFGYIINSINLWEFARFVLTFLLIYGLASR